MTETATLTQGSRPDAQARPAGQATEVAQPTGAKRTRISPLGMMMLAPALIVVTLFLITPAVLTTVFSFTNMTSATGITGGAYVISPNLLRDLKAEGLDPEVLEALGGETVSVDQAGLEAARKAGTDPRFLEEIEDEFLGKSFADSRTFFGSLKKLPNRPRRIVDVKRTATFFSHSILNTRFETRDGAVSAIRSIAPAIGPETLERVLERSYTGWVWTTENFVQLLTKPNTWRIVLNTAFYVAVTLSFNVLVGLFVAIATFYMPRRTGSLFNALWLLPRITPVVLYAILWKWLTWDTGFLAVIAEQIGLPSFNYMKGSVGTAWMIVVMTNGYVGASLSMILFSGALRTIPVQQLWASEVDGASRWQQVRYIILPQMRWPILFVTCYATLSLLSSYEQIWLTTDGGPGNTTTVWALEAFKTALSNYTGNLQYGMGAAMALILVIIGLGLSVLYLRLFRFDELVEKPKIEF